MKETKIASVEFTNDSNHNRDPYVIGLFASESCGKTRFGLTGPSGVGFVISELKSYATIAKDAEELGKQVLMPKDQLKLIPPSRKLAAMKDDIERQKFYIQHVKMVEDVAYGLLEHPDVKILVFDKFSHYCVWKEFAVNGMTPKFVKIDNKVYQSKQEVRASITDFINSLSQFGKPIVLNVATKADYEVLDAKGEPARNTWDCGSYYMLGSHCNVIAELERNPFWDMKKSGEKHSWKYGLNIRVCQRNPALEGPDGNPLLRDDEISLPRLIQCIDPNADLEAYL